ncbi:MAG: nuclear transport factor 2 family protein [Blastocatellia bacterium]|nr:nuclear transport factor 2 family protein [Blastocatellia bacterium]
MKLWKGTLPLSHLRNLCTASFFILGMLLAPGWFSAPTLAQDPAADRATLLKEINRDIWLPFAKAFAEDKAEDFISLHSKDMIRAEGNGKRILSLSQYAENTRKSFKTRIEAGGKIEIHFRFLERIVNPQFASERGIFEFVAISPKGETAKFYGKFHVFSRKETGTWKILVDYDSNEGKTINEESFKSAAALDDFKN